MSTTPYPNGVRQIAFFVLGAFGATTIAIWRGFIYDFTPGAWALAALAGAVGLVWTAAAGHREGRHQALLMAALGLAFLLEVVRQPLGLPPEATAGLWLFGGGASLVFAARSVGEAVSRRRQVRRWLSEAGSLRDPSMRAQLVAYFAASGRVEGALSPFEKAVARRLRRLSRKPGPSWQAAASALRAFVVAFDGYLDAVHLVPAPTCLEERAHENSEAFSALRTQCLCVARSLESASGERPDFGSFWEANRRALKVSREWHYAVGMLAAHHRVSVPRWFLKRNCELAKAG